jgi:hypothetical protein
MAHLPDKPMKEEPHVTRSVRYWVYSPFGDPILCVPDYAEALAYAREVPRRTMELIVVAATRTPIEVRPA